MAAEESSVFVVRMLIGLLGGVLIGLERERAQSRRSRKPGSVPGIRTFGLLSLYGSLSSYISSIYSGAGEAVFIIVSILPVVAFILVYAYTRMVRQGVTGITTYIVMIDTYLVGVLAGVGMILEAVSVAVLITLILALKTPAERLARSIEYRELIAMLEIAAIFLIIGPIVSTMEPILGLLDPMKVYLFFSMVITLSFTSYAAAKLWGARGLLYSAMLGSMVNSEAVMATVTRAAAEAGPRERREMLKVLVPLVIGVMQVRSSILVVAALYIFGGLEAVRSSVVVAPMAALSLAIVYAMVRMGLRGDLSIGIESPLSWGTAAKSALAYIILTLASAILAKMGAVETIPILGFLGGLVNATATILGIASVIPSIGVCSSLGGMLLAIASATLNKPIYADYSRLDAGERRMIWVVSILMSLIPASLAVVVILGAC